MMLPSASPSFPAFSNEPRLLAGGAVIGDGSLVAARRLTLYAFMERGLVLESVRCHPGASCLLHYSKKTRTSLPFTLVQRYGCRSATSDASALVV